MHGTKALPGAVFWQTLPISRAAAAAYPALQCKVKTDFRKNWTEFSLGLQKNSVHQYAGAKTFFPTSKR